MASDVSSLERHLRITDSVLKFITVKRDEGIYLEDYNYVESEQKNKIYLQPDALDVLLGRAEYTH
jgi:ribosomal protein S6